MALLWRHGIRSRLVSTLSAVGPLTTTATATPPFDYDSDGHIFMELWTGKHSLPYDPDAIANGWMRRDTRWVPCEPPTRGRSTGATSRPPLSSKASTAPYSQVDGTPEAVARI